MEFLSAGLPLKAVRNIWAKIPLHGFIFSHGLNVLEFCRFRVLQHLGRDLGTEVFDDSSEVLEVGKTAAIKFLDVWVISVLLVFVLPRT